MKKSDFELLKPGDKIFRVMDIGNIVMTIEKTYVSDFGTKYIIFEGSKKVKNWDGIYKCYNFYKENNHERSTTNRNTLKEY